MRGLNSPEKLHSVCRVVRKHMSLVVGLQEIKRSFVDVTMARSLWGNRPHKWVFLPSCGASASLLMLWDADAMGVKEILKGAFSISVLCSLTGSNVSWACFTVYGPCRLNEKAQF